MSLDNTAKRKKKRYETIIIELNMSGIYEPLKSHTMNIVESQTLTTVIA